MSVFCSTARAADGNGVLGAHAVSSKPLPTSSAPSPPSTGCAIRHAAINLPKIDTF